MPENPRDLVAPELAPAIDVFPDLDFDLGLDVIRTGFANREMPPMPPELETVTLEERLIPGPAGAPDVRIYHYSPPGQAAGPRAALLHIHGGGYVIGSPEINDSANRSVALALGITVVSVKYRLAPETVWPGAVQDCYAALTWLHDNAAAIGVDPARIAIAGESAGGGHAAALALYARSKGGPKICFQMLDAPMLDDRTGTTSDPHPHVGHFVWTPAKNRFGWRSMLGVEPGGEVPEGSVPARFEDLSGLPPTFITVGALDLFLEEDLDFIRRLTRAGVQAELHVIPGAYHGYSMAVGAPQVSLLVELQRKALARALGV